MSLGLGLGLGLSLPLAPTLTRQRARDRALAHHARRAREALGPQAHAHVAVAARKYGVGLASEGGELQPTPEQDPKGRGVGPLAVELCVPAWRIPRLIT